MPQTSTGTDSGYSGATYSESSGGGFTFFAVLAFVVASIYGIGETTKYFFPHIRHEILPYVGPDGLVSKNVFLGTLITLLTIIGILIRNILRWVLGIGLAVALVGAIVSLYLR